MDDSRPLPSRAGLDFPCRRDARRPCASENGDESDKDRGRTRPTIPDEPAESLLQIPSFSRPAAFSAGTLPSGGHPTAGRTGRAAPFARQAGTIVCGEKQPRWRMSSREWLHPRIPWTKLLRHRRILPSADGTADETAGPSGRAIARTATSPSYAVHRSVSSLAAVDRAGATAYPSPARTCSPENPS